MEEKRVEYVAFQTINVRVTQSRFIVGESKQIFEILWIILCIKPQQNNVKLKYLALSTNFEIAMQK